MAVTTDGEVTIVDLGDGDNRLTPGALDELATVASDLAATTGPRALVTRSSGKIWSNGLDLDHMAADPDGAPAYLRQVHEVQATLLVLGVPTVAAVTGHAFGAGAMLVLCHDTAVMRADRGYWCLPEVDLGMRFSPGFQAVLTTRLTPATLNEAVTTGRRFAADDAVEAGVVAETAPDSDATVARAIEVARARAPKAEGPLAGLKGDLYGAAVDLLRSS